LACAQATGRSELATQGRCSRDKLACALCASTEGASSATILPISQRHQCTSPIPRVFYSSINECLIGHLRELYDVWTFQYASSWCQDPIALSLSSGLLMATVVVHTNGASMRPVQWYFDNLLPEELLRDVLVEETRIDYSDAFDLLKHNGSESAGSLVLREPNAAVAPKGLKLPIREHYGSCPCHLGQGCTQRGCR